MARDKRGGAFTSSENKRRKQKAPGKAICSRPYREAGDEVNEEEEDGDEEELLLCDEAAPLGSSEENEDDDFREGEFDVFETAIESTYEDFFTKLGPAAKILGFKNPSAVPKWIRRRVRYSARDLFLENKSVRRIGDVPEGVLRTTYVESLGEQDMKEHLAKQMSNIQQLTPKCSDYSPLPHESMYENADFTTLADMVLSDEERWERNDDNEMFLVCTAQTVECLKVQLREEMREEVKRDLIDVMNLEGKDILSKIEEEDGRMKDTLSPRRETMEAP